VSTLFDFFQLFISIYLYSEYRRGVERVADRAGDFFEAHATYKTQDRLSLASLLQEPFRELPQVSNPMVSVLYCNLQSVSLRLCLPFEPFNIPPPFLYHLLL